MNDSDAPRQIPSPLDPPVKVELTVFPPHDCAYLPGRMASTRGLWAEKIPAGVYHAFMDRGFRRSGKFIYQPVCAACRECVPIRVPANEFTPTPSQRRAWRRNSDLSVRVGIPEAGEEKFALYQRYIHSRHEPKEAGDFESFHAFLYDSPVDTAEFTYRDHAGKLLGVGICDVCPQSFSSVYFYFDPDERRRSLGIFSALNEIEFARAHGIPFYYLGYWIKECDKMNYKANYRPCEILTFRGTWERLDNSPR